MSVSGLAGSSAARKQFRRATLGPLNGLTFLVRSLGERLIRLYYPDLTVVGVGSIPRTGPVLFVLNHPNGLLDPLVLRAAVGRPVRFLAKSTLFGNPLGRLAMEAFGSVPVLRAQDVKTNGRDRAAANEATFARCRALLADGEALALFPEGTSHSDPRLRPLKSGAARIALSAEDEHRAGQNAPLGLVVIPAGLGYEQKSTFRSRVILVVGRPILASDRLAAYHRDERAAVDELTEDVKARLAEVVLQAESRELLEGVARVASWTDRTAAHDLGAQHHRTRQLLDAYRRLTAEAPEQVEPVVRAARRYARVLQRLGVRDPWALELSPIGVAGCVRALSLLSLAAPVAALGALLGWLPYRLAGRVAARVARDEDVLGTVKLLGGALFLFAAWSVEAIAVGVVAGAAWGAATFIAGPVAGYVALRFDEMLGTTIEAMRLLWLRGARSNQARRLAERRRALADQVAAALGEDAPPPRPS